VVGKNTYSPNGGLLVMNPMVESKKNILNKSRKCLETYNKTYLHMVIYPTETMKSTESTNQSSSGGAVTGNFLFPTYMKHPNPRQFV